MKASSLIASILSLSFVFVAGAARADRFTQRQEGELVRLKNEDARVSILVPPGFTAQSEKVDDFTAISLTSPGGEALYVSRDPMKRELFRERCRTFDGFRMEKHTDHDVCQVSDDRGSGVVLWTAPGYTVAGESSLLEIALLQKLVETAARTVRFSRHFEMDVPPGYTFRNDDGTEYYADGKGHAFQVLIDNTGAPFTDGALTVAKRGDFGAFESFRLSQVGQSNGADFARVDAVQDGQPIIGVLWRRNDAIPVWVFAIGTADEGPAAAALSQRIVSSLVIE